MTRWWLRQRPGSVLAAAGLLISLIAVCDWRFVINATLGFLYIFPIAMLGTVMRIWQLLLVALFCMYLSMELDSFPMDSEVPRSILIFLTLATTGLLSRGIAKGYRSEMGSLARLKEEMAARQTEVAARLAAEEQLEFLIQSSPAAILTMASDGQILLANPAAHLLLDVPEGRLVGRRIARYIPELGSIPSLDETTNIYRTEMQTRGQREQGEVFLANVFFSTYRTAAGPRLAALIVDASEHLREREESSLQQLLAGSRILVAAVSHEVRNVCAAIGVVHENLARSGKLRENQDFESLGSLINTLSKIASLELKRSTGGFTFSHLDIQEVLTDLRIVLELSCEESEIELRWSVPGNLPRVRADRQLLMQILLNLTKNSQRALETTESKWIEVSGRRTPDGISISITDSGPGIPIGRELFQPLQKGADATGLGLYLSRAFARSFQGDLRRDPTVAGCSFVLELLTVPD
jgi:two-component system, LuxR family, sensor kinase FixL